MNPLLQSSRRFFRRHPGQLLMALAGMAAGVAVMTGVALVRDLLIDALDAAGEELSGRDSLRISTHDGRLDEAVFARLATEPGAPELVPVLRHRARIDEHDIELLGIDPFSGGQRSLALPPDMMSRLLQLPVAAGATRTTLERLGRGANGKLPVTLGSATTELAVAGTLPDSRGLDDRLVMDIAALQHLTGRQGELSWIDAPPESAAWLEQRLPNGLELTQARERRDSAARLTEGMRANLTAMGLISMAVGLFVIYSVLSFLLVQRRRTLAMLRALGVTRGQITHLLMTETTAIAGLGTLLGLALGTLLADGLVDLLRAPVAEIYGRIAPSGVQPTVALYAQVGTLALLMALAAIAGLLGEARSVPPGQLLRSRPPVGRTGRRVALALVLLVLALVVLAASSGLPAAFGALFLALAGFALLAPSLGVGVLTGLRRLSPTSLPGRAVALLLAGQARIRPALAALALAMALATGLAMMVSGFRDAVDDWIDRLLRADAYVSAERGAIDAETAARIRDLPGLSATSSARRVRLADGRDLVAYDLPPEAWSGFEWLAGEPVAAYTAFETGRAAIVSEPLARRAGLGVGEPVAIPAPGGAFELPLAGVYRDYASERGSIAIDAALYRARFDDSRRDSIGLYLEAGAEDTSQLETRLKRIDADLRLTPREQVRAGTLAVFDRTFRISRALAALVGLIAVISLVSALLALGLERRRDYAILRALGLAPARLHALVIAQTACLALAAAVVAVPLAMAIHLGLSLVVQPRAFGWTLPLSWPLAPLLAMPPLALACGLLAGAWPAWRAGRRQPAMELRGG